MTEKFNKIRADCCLGKNKATPANDLHFSTEQYNLKETLF